MTNSADQITWLLQKPTDLDLHCLLRQDMTCSAREGLKWGQGDFTFTEYTLSKNLCLLKLAADRILGFLPYSILNLDLTFHAIWLSKKMHEMSSPLKKNQKKKSSEFAREC